jgi:hypothetical protein
MANLKNTYWNRQGRYPVLEESLGRLVPAEGSVKNPQQNKALERFRKARNCYYDLYNNGLCNRAKEFRWVFGFPAQHKYGDRIRQDLTDRTEAALNEIILEAAREQKII